MKLSVFSMVLALLLAWALAAAWFAYRRDLDRQLERVSTGSQLIDTRCGPVEYASVGQGPALLLVHGAGGGFDQGLGIAQDLAERGLRTITMSRFGYLRAPLPADASPAAQADAHACLLDALGVQRAAIMGVSAGAPSSMQFALRHAERTSGLILLVPLAYAPRPQPASEMSATTRFMLEKAVRSDLLYWLALKLARPLVVRTVLATPPEALAAASALEQMRAGEVMERLLPLSQRERGLQNDWVIGTSIGRYALEQIQAPTLVISLKDDLYGTFESARYTAVHIPGARFVGYPSGGHAWLGHHDDVLAEISAFLGAVRAPLAASAR
jgi:pimeloyl-ACP methyl ester carboxylesterase